MSESNRKAGVICEDVNGVEIEVMPQTWSKCVKIPTGENLDEVLIKAPHQAEVGQILAVKAIDSSGRPTEWEVINTSEGGVKNYNELENLPEINGIPLSGNKTAADLGLITEVTSKSANGLCPKLPDESSVTKFLRQDGTWNVPSVSVTKEDIGLSNVENKSSATIRGELTSANITNALGYTPAQEGSGVGDFVKSGNIIGSSSNITTYYNKSSCSVYSYINKTTKAVCVDVTFETSKELIAGTAPATTFANISATYAASCSVRTFIITQYYTICVYTNSSGNIVVGIASGTVPANTSLNARLEWHYV